MKEKKKIILLIVLFAFVLTFFFVPQVNRIMKEVFRVFATGDFRVLRDFVAHYGVYAALVSFLLMVFQSLAAPLPAFLITFANANLFGWWRGAILSWSSAMAGRDAAEKLTSKAGMGQIEEFFKKYGKNTVLICRLLPFVSFDYVSYAAGLTSMSFWSFFVATGIGQLPATLVYSYVGSFLTGGAKIMVTGLFILFALSASVMMLRHIYQGRKKNEK